MTYRLAADALVLLHLGFILFAAFGGCLVWYRVRFAWLHVPALLWGLWIEVSHGICPLTPLENELRRRAGESGYATGFIEHYLIPLIYPPALAPPDQVVIATLLLLINVAVYTAVLRRYRRRADAAS